MTSRSQGCCLGVFAKHWTPGRVKTRLAASIGDEKAAQVYQHFVKTTVTRLDRLPVDKTVAFTPRKRKPELEAVARGWNLAFQGEGGLGERMQRFFAERFQEGYERVVLLGTDSPHVPLEYVEEAFKRLTYKDSVFGPTDDGGYYLIGLSRPADRLFEEIPWSTPEVWLTTQKRLEDEGIPFATVPTWYDVDTLADLSRLRDDLKQSHEPELSELASNL